MAKTVGEKIKARRLELGWSLRELAKRMGYANQSTVARIESGEIDIPQSKVVRFAEVMSTTIPYLMGWEEEIKKDPAKLAERHFEILIDEDLSEIFDDFKVLDKQQKKIVKDLVHSLASSKRL